MPSHPEIEAGFRAGIAGGALPEGLAPHPDLARRFAVYRNNVAHSLSDALAQRFPVVARITGGDFFTALARDFAFRRKRGAHLFSKHRYLAAQMDAYLQADLWKELAEKANARCDQLLQGLKGLGLTVHNDTHANMIFFEMPRAAHRKVLEAGAVYYVTGDLDGDGAELLTGRLVCDWSLTPSDVSAFVDALRDAA